ncbi:hypothetical protein B0H12DRAFT_295073 [Mycena haematopus]|nr:hypothetical protein B0H12DRAFT_295073 [Mycena haematopus]
MVVESLNPHVSASEPSTTAQTESLSTHRPPPPPPIQTGSELQRKKLHKARSRPQTDRQDKASRPIRTRTMSTSISAMSPATPKIAHLSRSDMSVPGSSAASSPNSTPFGFDFTAPIESRGRKRKIESVYSVSPLTSDSEDDSSGKGSAREPNRHNSRPAQSAAPDGCAFGMNARIVIPWLTNPEAYSKPTTEYYAMTSVEPLTPTVFKNPRKASTTEMPSPRKVTQSPVAPLQHQHYKLYAISSSPSTNPFDPANPAMSIPPFHNWRHPEELAYIGPSHSSAAEWTDIRIVTYMVDNAFSIPSRNADSKQTWVEVKVGAVNTILPRGYRIPLLWLGRVQWDCLKLLLTTGKDQWPALKFDVLHIARLSVERLAKARKEVKMKRQYRNVMFDRALSRFFNGWMGSRDEFVWDFYREFRDEEYEDDMLQRRWLQKAVKGGFAITEHELNEGITADQFMLGLNLDREKGTYEWIDHDAPAPGTTATSPPPDPAVEEPQLTPAIETPQPTPAIEAPQPTPAIEAPQPTPAIEALQPTPTIEAALQSSSLRVEQAANSRGHSPLSLSQVAGVRSASSSPLTPVYGLDHPMDVDPPAQPAAAIWPLSDRQPEQPQPPPVQVNDAAEPLVTVEPPTDPDQWVPDTVSVPAPSLSSSRNLPHLSRTLLVRKVLSKNQPTSTMVRLRRVAGPRPCARLLLLQSTTWKATGQVPKTPKMFLWTSPRVPTRWGCLGHLSISMSRCSTATAPQAITWMTSTASTSPKRISSITRRLVPGPLLPGLTALSEIPSFLVLSPILTVLLAPQFR